MQFQSLRQCLLCSLRIRLVLYGDSVLQKHPSRPINRLDLKKVRDFLKAIFPKSIKRFICYNIYLEFTLRDEDFESYCRACMTHRSKFNKNHAAKIPQAVGLGGPQGPNQCFFTCQTICQKSQEIAYLYLKLFRLKPLSPQHDFMG